MLLPLLPPQRGVAPHCNPLLRPLQPAIPACFPAAAQVRREINARDNHSTWHLNGRECRMKARRRS